MTFVKHYLIDFGASLGSASFRANSPRDGNVYLFDWKSSAKQFLTLGMSVPKWQRAQVSEPAERGPLRVRNVRPRDVGGRLSERRLRERESVRQAVGGAEDRGIH